MRSVVINILILLSISISISANTISDFFEGECVNFDDLRQSVNPRMDNIDPIFYVKGNFSGPHEDQGTIALNLFDDPNCEANLAGSFSRSWDGEMFYCGSGSVSECYRRRGLYTFMTELLLEILKDHRFKLFCIGSFAQTNNELYNSIDGSEEEKILATAIGKTVISYFGREAIVKAGVLDGKYCIELSAYAW